VRGWHGFAQRAEVMPGWTQTIGENLRLGIA